MQGPKIGHARVRVQAKLNTMIGKSSGFIESLPPLVQARIEFLRDLQQQHDDFEEQFLKERAELEAKYRKLYGEGLGFRF